MTLDDTIWRILEGGYRQIYDASAPLKKLEKTNDPNEIREIWSELWDNLHHQGDVGIASYLALPQMLRIEKLKKTLSLNLLGLSLVIEQQRVLRSNPTLPAEFKSYYYQGLEDLYQYILINIQKDLDNETLEFAIAMLATCKGFTKLGKAIMEMADTTILDKFLEQF